jgi:predicted small secreted protein
MWKKVYHQIFYLALTLSLAACNSLDGIGKGISGAFKGFQKFIP